MIIPPQRSNGRQGYNVEGLLRWTQGKTGSSVHPSPSPGWGGTGEQLTRGQAAQAVLQVIDAEVIWVRVLARHTDADTAQVRHTTCANLQQLAGVLRGGPWTR